MQKKMAKIKFNPSSLLKDIILVIVIFSVLLILKYDTLNHPFYWDDMTLGTAIKEFHDNPLSFKVIAHPYLIHTPLLPHFFGVVSALIGYKLEVFHIIIILIGALGIYYMFLLSEHIIKDRFYAILAAITLLFVPIFFSFLGRVYYDIPLITLIIMCFYFLFKERYAHLTFFSVIGVLTKEIFILIIPTILFWILVRRNRKYYTFLAASFVFLFWACLAVIYKKNELTTILPEFFPKLTPGSFYNWIDYLKLTLLDNWFFMLTFPAIITSIYASIKKKNKAEDYAFYIYILTSLGFFFFSAKLSRYMLPLYPFLIILFFKNVQLLVNNITSDIGRKAVMLPACLIIMLLFIGSFHSEENSSCGCVLEKNLDYVDSLTTYALASEFIESKGGNESVLTQWPFSSMLELPYLGYVKKEIKVEYFKNESNIDYRYIAYSPQIHSPDVFEKFIDEELRKGNIVKIKEFQVNNAYSEIYEKIK